MKVVHVTTSDSGGAGIAAGRLHRALLEEGVNSHFLTLLKSDDSVPNHTQYFPGEGKIFKPLFNRYFNLRKSLRYRNIYINSSEKKFRNKIKGRSSELEYFSNLQSGYNLQDHPLIKSADIVHLHWVSDTFFDFRSFFKNNRKKIVWTLHDMNSFTGGCHHSDGCMKFKSDCDECPQLIGTSDLHYAKYLLKEKIESCVSKFDMQIITPSNWLGDLSKESKLFGSFLHSVIPNPINPDEFRIYPVNEAREHFGLPLNRKLLLFNASTITNKRKGLNYLIEAVSLLKEDAVLVAIGNSPVIKGDSKIHSFGYLKTPEEISKAYSSVNIFVLPSLAENLPNSICESLICGTPAIGFDVGGIPELINSQTGKLVPLGNVKLLADAIDEVLKRPGMFDEQELRKWAIAKFGSKMIASRYMDVYAKFGNNA